MKLLAILWDMRHPFAFISQYIKTPITFFLNRIFETYRQKTNDSVLSVKELLFKAGVIALLTSCVVWVSVFLYVAFYYSYIPNIGHSRPVHLQFKSCNADQGICSYPSSHVELTRKHQLLMVGQSYRIRLALDMPESEINKKLGMFLCCIELRAKGGHLVSRSCRSGMLPYKSDLLAFMATLFYSPLLIWGFIEEKKTVEIEMYSDYKDDQATPVTDVYVEIESRHIQLYSATLYIEAHLTGLRYIMFHWPMFSAFLGISTNLMFVAFVCALSWYHLQHGSEIKESDESEEMIKEHGDDPFMDFDDFQEPQKLTDMKKEILDLQFLEPISLNDSDTDASVLKEETESQA